MLAATQFCLGHSRSDDGSRSKARPARKGQRAPQAGSRADCISAKVGKAVTYSAGGALTNTPVSAHPVTHMQRVHLAALSPIGGR